MAESEVDLSTLDPVALGKELLEGGAPIARQMRVCFLLKHRGGEAALDALARGFESTSVLLKHEIAYVMGQMKDPYAVPLLSARLQDTNEDPIVRHEAAEALGAIGNAESLDLLEKFSTDPCKEVSETCILAMDTLRHKAQHSSSRRSQIYCSEDPAPLLEQEGDERLSVHQLKDILLDSSLNLFKRYRAMFTLREQGSDKEAVLAICDGLKDSSALFRHECAYVLGQIMHPAATDALVKCVRNEQEHEMVRHEAAEALGSISEENSQELLREFLHSDNRVLSESCAVALDLKDFWTKQVGQ